MSTGYRMMNNTVCYDTLLSTLYINTIAEILIENDETYRDTPHIGFSGIRL